MRIVFIRHGEPDYENDCLTENGIVQAKATAERLLKENISGIYSSPMGRAKQTASFTAEKYGLDVKILDFMHEIDWGDVSHTCGVACDSESKDGKECAKLEYDGHPWTLAFKLLTEQPEYISNSEWKNHHYFKDNVCMQYYQKISEGVDKFLLNFGLERKNDLYYCAEEYEKNAEKTIALFAHGGSGSILISHVLNLPFPFVLTSMPYGVCSVSVIELSKGMNNFAIPRLELFNDMNHIESFKLEKLKFEK